MKHHKGKVMPFPSFPNLIDKCSKNPVYLPIVLKQEASDMMSLSQHILDKSYLEEGPMDNKIRTKLFGFQFCKSFHYSCEGRFEFFEVFVESDAALNRHIDYRNDISKSYDYGCSYSYLIVSKNDSKLYRVNFIMTTRLVCGQFMTENS